MATSARNIRLVPETDLNNSALVGQAHQLIQAGHEIECSKASVEIDGEWKDDLEGIVYDQGGIIADPRTNALLALSYTRTTQLWNKFAREVVE